MLKRFLVIFVAVALLALPGCAGLGQKFEPLGDVFGEIGSAFKDGGERIFNSFEVEADKDGATVKGIGVEAGVNWKQWGCILAGKFVPSLCEDAEPEAE